MRADMASDRRAALGAVDDPTPEPGVTGTATPAVQAAALTKAYRGRKVLRDVNLDVREGQCLALLGHNGAGKTTLFKLMLGMIRPTSGSIRVAGAEPGTSAYRALQASLGFLPENIAFHDAMTGEETLRFYARLQGVSPSGIAGSLERVGLADASGRRIATYSKGMRQRLGLAQALMGEPRLLLLDEPTTGLDPALRRRFFDTVRELRSAGVTLIISTHALREVETLADRVAILNGGRLIAEGTLTDLRRTAKLPVQFRIAVTSGAATRVTQRFEDRYPVTIKGATQLSFACPESDKLALIREIAGIGDDITDVDIAPPGLDDIYAHFNDRENGS